MFDRILPAIRQSYHGNHAPCRRLRWSALSSPNWQELMAGDWGKWSTAATQPLIARIQSAANRVGLIAQSGPFKILTQMANSQDSVCV